jgi:hypothetical protein
VGTSITINRDDQIAAERIAVVNMLLERTSRGPTIHNSFFSRCERDESGRCLPGSGSSPVKKGAMIGGAIGAGRNAIAEALVHKRLGNIGGSKIARTGVSGLVGAGIGAGIGALIKRSRAKREAKNQTAQKQWLDMQEAIHQSKPPEDRRIIEREAELFNLSQRRNLTKKEQAEHDRLFGEIYRRQLTTFKVD